MTGLDGAIGDRGLPGLNGLKGEIGLPGVNGLPGEKGNNNNNKNLKIFKYIFFKKKLLLNR